MLRRGGFQTDEGYLKMRVKTLAFAIFLFFVLVFGNLCRGDEGEGPGDARPNWFCITKVESGHVSFTGSGVWLTQRHVLTCWHNVRREKGKPSQLVVVDHKDREYSSVVVYKRDERADLCLLYVRDRDLTDHGTIDVSSEQRHLGCVWNVGMDTDGKGFRIEPGFVTRSPCWSYSKTGKPACGDCTSAFTCQGMSGGPAIDDVGDVVGVNIAFLKGETRMVRLQYLQKFLD